MKARLESIVRQALEQLTATGELTLQELPEIKLEKPKQDNHGHLATNIALQLAKPQRKNPRQLAEAIVAALPDSVVIAKVELAGPGFINFFLTPEAFQEQLQLPLQEQENYGRSPRNQEKIQVEFVSANPTGPLHVGHGRGAAYGASLAHILDFAGFNVHREYYVNDAGRQMDILAISVWIRYLEISGSPLRLPTKGYQGDYICTIAKELHERDGERHRIAADTFPALPSETEDPEAYLDAIIEGAKQALGDDFSIVHRFALDSILADIKDDLEEFGVVYQEWYSERSLMDRGLVAQAVEQLQQKGHLYEKEGALWFRSTAFGDDKDRVVQRDNGLYTYFASDIAYHADKYARGFDTLINIWGADHHGYIKRVQAAMEALGHPVAPLQILLVQFAVLWRGKEKASMSTRSGEFVTLRELRQEVGNDAARFFYILRRSDQHLDFDLELAKQHSEDNPVFYVQYAHARIHSVLKQLVEKGLPTPSDWTGLDLSPLTGDKEIRLIEHIVLFPEVVQLAARDREPHQIAFYLKELASHFHTFYNAHRVLVDDETERNARLALIVATAQVIANGLGLLGVTAPKQM